MALPPTSLGKLASMRTARLALRPRTIDDLENNLRMDLDPEVHRYIFDKPPDPAALRARLVRQIESDWPAAGGFLTVTRRGGGAYLGWCGLFPLEDSGLIEIGYRFVRAAWGDGVASEAAQAVLDAGFRKLGFDPIVAVVHPGNRASQRVIAKLGFVPGGTRQYYGRELLFYRLGRAEHLARDQN